MLIGMNEREGRTCLNPLGVLMRWLGCPVFAEPYGKLAGRVTLVLISMLGTQPPIMADCDFIPRGIETLSLRCFGGESLSTTAESGATCSRCDARWRARVRMLSWCLMADSACVLRDERWDGKRRAKLVSVWIRAVSFASIGGTVG